MISLLPKVRRQKAEGRRLIKTVWIVGFVQTGIMVKSGLGRFVNSLIEEKKKLYLFCLQPLTLSKALLMQPKAPFELI